MTTQCLLGKTNKSSVIAWLKPRSRINYYWTKQAIRWEGKICPEKWWTCTNYKLKKERICQYSEYRKLCLRKKRCAPFSDHKKKNKNKKEKKMKRSNSRNWTSENIIIKKQKKRERKKTMNKNKPENSKIDQSGFGFFWIFWSLTGEFLNFTAHKPPNRLTTRNVRAMPAGRAFLVRCLRAFGSTSV